MLLKAISVTESEDIPDFEAQKMAAEEKQSGNLRWEVIYGYFTAGGSLFFLLFNILMILLTAASASAADFWISYW